MKLEDKVVAIVKENIERDCAIMLTSNFQEDLGVDSFEMLMIANALEDEFKITIAESEYQQIKIVADIVRLAKERKLEE